MTLLYHIFYLDTNLAMKQKRMFQITGFFCKENCYSKPLIKKIDGLASNSTSFIKNYFYQAKNFIARNIGNIRGKEGNYKKIRFLKFMVK